MSIVPIEHAIMDYCSDQMNLTALFAAQEDLNRNLNGQLAMARAQVEKTEASVQTLMDMIEAAGDQPPSMFIERAKKRELELTKQRQDVADLEYKIKSAHRAAQPAMADVWAALRDGVEQLDPKARTKARQLVVDTFKEIAIKAVTWRGEDLIELRLTSKSEVIKGFRIDRKTGEWHSEVVVDNPQHEDLKPRRQIRNRKAATVAA